MPSLSLTALALCLAVATAKQCHNLTIPVIASSRSGVFNVSATQSNIEVTDFILDGVGKGSNATARFLKGYATVSGLYNVAATYCVPSGGKWTAQQPSVIQVLTHGIGFDRSYWDLAFDNFKYSYTSVATDQYGFATFSFDRLGIGQSARADPIGYIQAQLETNALEVLSRALRDGSNAGVPKYSRLIHIGHSFGSVQSYALARNNPPLTSGLVLSGFSQNITFLPYFQLGANFIAVQTSPLANQYPAGYFAAKDASAMQANFFAPGNFDPAILPFATATAHPVPQRELLTISGATYGKVEASVPVLVITGERDLPFCGGDCLATGKPLLSDIPSAAAPDFPNAAPFLSHIVPSSGHALNLEKSYATTYDYSNNFLCKNGLASGRR